MEKIAALVLSGGKGLRTGGTIPKQYVEVGGQPLLVYSLAAFEQSQADAVFIAAADEYIRFVREEIVGYYRLGKVKDVIPGGRERCFSVLSGLRAIKEAGDYTYVMIHDGARPFISPKGINRMIDAVRTYGAAVAASHVKDTVKITDSDGFVLETTDRPFTWRAETPQCFRLDCVLAAYEKLIAPLEEDKEAEIHFTDDESVWAGAFPERKVKLVELEEDNDKVTTPVELAYAQWRIASGSTTVLDQEVL